MAGDMEGFNKEMTIPNITPRMRAVTMRLTKLFRFFSTMISTPVYNNYLVSRSLWDAQGLVRRLPLGSPVSTGEILS